MNRIPTEVSIVVLAGGESPEREISCESGACAANALRARGHSVHEVDPADVSLGEMSWPEQPVVLNMLHGEYGEDGTLQSELDRLKIPYTGSDSACSKLTFHKDQAKNFLLERGLSTPPFRLIDHQEKLPSVLQAASEIGFPLFMKPNAQGSSLGVSVVYSPENLYEGWGIACEYECPVILEKAIIGEEWTVPFLDHVPLPPIKIAPSHPFFDYSAKYEDESTRYNVINVDENPVARHVTEISQNACEMLGTHGVCRVDLIADEAGQGWILEVNTSPGMTSHSLVPMSAAALGWDLGELCERNILSAFTRFTNQETKPKSHD
ncbi:D-alanine--D-alanine ligase Ddl [Thalassoglobus neptunius]|uniref:D-alanine--D-alanine ligase n=1 Tax=Thalassoglobus neptunius TaxID=1938619 RepID=A0A5C5X9U7_9PLAN|nr:D-alanine--D-alanine ligase [Thalassoglobus neptunius]TWT58632.1 D-alanine--D-alanine ligase Ddl [Thalassoglobus neptunius]